MIGGEKGKIDRTALEQKIAEARELRPHSVRAGALSLTQGTECGTVYAPEHMRSVIECAHQHGLPVHVDGARFANALASLECSAAELTSDLGVDVMSFGATKNGALAAEAVVFFNLKYAEHFDYQHKRAGQLMSKTRFFSAQFLAMLENDRWLINARHANTQAKSFQIFFQGLVFYPLYPVEINEVFVFLPGTLADHLVKAGARFYSWGGPEQTSLLFVCSWVTSDVELETFEKALRSWKK